MLPHNPAALAPGSWEPCPQDTVQPDWPVPPRAVCSNRGRLLRADLGDRVVIAKRFRSVERAHRELAIASRLAEHCPHVLAPALLGGRDGSAWLATPYLEGIPWYRHGGAEETFAHALANLHAALRKLPEAPIAAAGRARAARTLDWLEAHVADEEVGRLAAAGRVVPRQLAPRLRAFLARAPQPVHNDLHGGNVWWSGGRIWFLDLEEVASSHLPPIADLMRYTERHLFVTSVEGASADSGDALEALWKHYHRECARPLPNAAEAFDAAAWNWLDTWSALRLTNPPQAEYAIERGKFAVILGYYERHWARFAGRLERMRASA